MVQQRDLLTSAPLAPPWLAGYNSNGQKFLYCIGLALDMLLEKHNEGQLAKCPGQADDSAIPLQAADRLLIQGPAETNASFLLRLKNAFDAWSIAGSRRSIMEQLQAYLTDLQPGVTGTDPQMLIVGGNTDLTTWDALTYDAPQGAVPAHTIVEPANWDWDGLDRPWRNWLVLFMHLVPTGVSGSTLNVASTGGSGVAGVTSGFATLTGLSGMVSDDVQRYITISGAASSANNGTFQIVARTNGTTIIIANPNAVAPDANNGSISWTIGEYPYIGPAPVWGSPDFIWGEDFTWGVRCSPLVIQSIRQILQRWKSGKTFYPNIIISFGGGDGTAGNEFSPLSSMGAGNPDGTWGGFGKLVDGCWVPSVEPLNSFTAFCDGTGQAVSCYEKNIG